MACLSPLDGWLSRKRTKTGKRSVVFKLPDAYQDMPVQIPCGRCTGCRLEKSRQWAMRCMHEAELHDANSFITLTYANEHLPPGGTLVKSHFQKFMKRLRARNNEHTIRFYQCGEYGERHDRPHYHALLFGHDFPDKEYLTSRGAHHVYTSPTLEELWPFGLSETGSVTFESAAYVARYITKKYDNPRQPEKEQQHYHGRIKEYATMSRRPGIGKAWFDKYGKEVYDHDSVIINAKEVRPPKYYDKLLEGIDLKQLNAIKKTRKSKINENEQTSTRLMVKKNILDSRTKLFTQRTI